MTYDHELAADTHHTLTIKYIVQFHFDYLHVCANYKERNTCLFFWGKSDIVPFYIFFFSQTNYFIIRRARPLENRWLGNHAFV